MRNKNTLVLSIIFIALVLIAFTGCSNEEELWVYKPMISIGDNLYGVQTK